MIIINFYISNNEKWIEYNLNDQIIKTFFETDDELKEFIKNNNLNLIYKECLNC